MSKPCKTVTKPPVGFKWGFSGSSSMGTIQREKKVRQGTVVAVAYYTL
jgi:hypothetical protein